MINYSLKHNFTLAISLAVVAILVVGYSSLQDSEVSVKYDCRMLMGGWHPDVPPEVQRECRKLMSRNI